MTIEEKLQHFYDTSVAEAQTEAENTLEAHKKSLEEMFEKHKESRKMDAEAQIKAETENATREVNKALSADQLHYTRLAPKTQPQPPGASRAAAHRFRR